MLTYRPEIDGLRAVAVVAVVIFHLDPDWLPQGYLGVDVFFVISGFLIASLLLKEREQTGRIDFRAFYARRARRLLPALIVVVLVTLLVAAAVQPYRIYEDVASSALASLAFVANWFFMGQVSYFAPTAHEQPLLHLWTLGVEEQFYIVFPVLVWAIFKLGGRRALMWAIAGVLVASLGPYLLTMVLNANVAFYGTHTRAWQLAMGVMLAAIGRTPGFASGRYVAPLGLTLVVATFCIPPEMRVLPIGIATCIGAAMVIAAANVQGGFVYRLLACKPMVWLGKRSYSLYLWHWPVIIFTSMLLAHLGMIQVLLAVGLSVGLAALSYTFLEEPIRRRRLLRTPWRALAASAVAVAGTATAAVSSAKVHDVVGDAAGFAVDDHDAERLKRVRAGFKGARIRTCWVSRIDQLRDAITPDSDCVTFADDKPNVLVVGDSHSAQLYPALVAVLLDVNVSLLAANSCNLAIGRSAVKRETCDFLRDYLLTNPQAEAFDAIIAGPRVLKPARRDYLAGVSEIAQRIENPIIVVGPVPFYTPPQHTLDPLYAPRSERVREAAFTASLEPGMFELDPWLDERMSALDGVTYISSIDIFCPEGPTTCRHTTEDGHPITMDATHLSPAAALFLAEAIRDSGVVQASLDATE